MSPINIKELDEASKRFKVEEDQKGHELRVLLSGSVAPSSYFILKAIVQMWTHCVVNINMIVHTWNLIEFSNKLLNESCYIICIPIIITEKEWECIGEKEP